MTTAPFIAVVGAIVRLSWLLFSHELTAIFQSGHMEGFMEGFNYLCSRYRVHPSEAQYMVSRSANH